VSVDIAGEGADELPRTEKNLVVSAMRATFDELGGQPRGIEISCANRIPQGRGLGSSAAAIVAGVLLARALVLSGDQAMPMSAVLELASRLEGHPDNVAACLLGGLTIAWTSSDAPPAGGNGTAPSARSAANLSSLSLPTVNAVKVALDLNVTPFVFVPPTSSSTKSARLALPKTVPHADAAHNVARAALLIAALAGTAESASDVFDDGDQGDAGAATGPADVLLAATDDRLHQPYRRAGMTDSADLVAALRKAGVAAVISGAGPTVLALTRNAADIAAARAAVPAGWAGSQLAVDRVGAHQVLANR
jgi:homoserine kinase